jgi:hypothetical protein
VFQDFLKFDHVLPSRCDWMIVVWVAVMTSRPHQVDVYKPWHKRTRLSERGEGRGEVTLDSVEKELFITVNNKEFEGNM